MTACLIILLGISIGVIIQPFIEDPWLRRTLNQIFGVALLCALGFGGRALWRWPPRIYWLILLAAALAVPFVLFAHAFGQFNLFSLLFHMEFGTEGSTLAGLGDSIGVAILCCGLFALSVLWLWNWAGPPRWFLPAMLAVMIVINPAARFVFSYLSTPELEDTLTGELRRPAPTSPDLTPDIVLIYLEGVERGLGDTARFGSAYDVMTRLEPRAVTFTNVAEIAGTDWSIAGLAATLCGLPLLPNGLRFRNNFAGQTAFLSDHTCLTDIWQDMGYQMAFLKGTDKEFAGFNHFLGSHGFDTITDRAALRDRYPATEFDAASAGWTIDDQLLLDAARADYLTMVQDPAPLALVVETIGPHGATSYFSRECSDDGQAFGSADAVGATRCTLDAVDRFVTFIDENRQGRPTAVLFLSDHLNHAPQIAGALEYGNRRNTVTMLGLGYLPPMGQAGAVVDKAGSMIDVYPTLLTWLGMAGPDVRAGLGVSLFSDQPTLIEQFGREGLNARLIPNPALASAIWN